MFEATNSLYYEYYKTVLIQSCEIQRRRTTYNYELSLCDLGMVDILTENLHRTVIMSLRVFRQLEN